MAPNEPFAGYEIAAAATGPAGAASSIAGLFGREMDWCPK